MAFKQTALHFIQNVFESNPDLFLDGLDLSSLPKEIKSIADKVKFLSLRGNNFTNLEVLDLSCNRLRTVPESIRQLPNLVSLDLSGNFRIKFSSQTDVEDFPSLENLTMNV